MLKLTKILMLLTDVGFILYWIATALAWFPPEWLFKDYHDPFLVAWNWSFLPLDLLVSATGLGGMFLSRRRSAGRPAAVGRQLMTISLTFTVCSGLMAIAFWAFRTDFDPLWWAFNGFLLLYPIPGLVALMGGFGQRGAMGHREKEA